MKNINTINTNNTKYKIIMGLEVHIEPNTKSKMFCSCPQDHFGQIPNSQTCPICLGLPGSLPYANRVAVEKTVKLGLALGSSINKFSRFFRKHYFYPDLVKSFQTSQKDDPLCLGGELLGKQINHIHLEEDAGKLQHEVINGNKVSLIDFNRCGCALIELVTEPVFHEISEVLEFLKELQLIARYTDISTADMEKGTMRLEANISMKDVSKTKTDDNVLPNYKVELKNINSFKFLEKALKAEIERQTKALDNGETLIQETRGYDEVKQITYSQRIKTGSDDYKYFPEADLPPMVLSDDEIETIRLSLPELPQIKRDRFVKDYSMSLEFVEILISDKKRADYFEEAAKLNNNYKLLANLMINKKMDQDYPEPAGLVKKIVELSKTDFADNSKVSDAVSEVISQNPDIVESYRNGKGQVIGFLIGQVQKILQGKGDPKTVAELLTKSMNS